uniref:Activin_recp domain-containing protein n=1 Tax=Parastrongyloides trichosuri TaxID=131310 RepID=A0A0N4ZM72_PARTI
MNPLTGLQLNRTIDCETDEDHTFNIHGGCSYICTDPKNDCVMKMAKDTHFCCCATDDCNRFHGTGLRH